MEAKVNPDQGASKRKNGNRTGNSIDGACGSISSTPERSTTIKSARAIPRPPNAWILYRAAKCKDYRANSAGLDGIAAMTAAASSSASQIASGVNPAFVNQQDISRLVSTAWKQESDTNKQYWRSLAEERKQEHRERYPDYKFAPTPSMQRNASCSGDASTVEGDEENRDLKSEGAIPMPEGTDGVSASIAVKATSKKKSTAKSVRGRSKSLSIKAERSNSPKKRKRKSAKMDENDGQSMTWQKSPDQPIVPGTEVMNLDNIEQLLQESSTFLNANLQTSPLTFDFYTHGAALETPSEVAPWTPLTPQMTYARSKGDTTEACSTFDFDLALQQLADWPSHPFDVFDGGSALSTSDNHAIVGIRSDPQTGSSTGDFSTAFESLWSQPKGSWQGEGAEAPSLEGCSSVDPNDALHVLSSAFLQPSFAAKE